MKYSKIIKIQDKLFRYNYKDGEIEWVDKINNEYIVIYSAGLSKNDWDEDSTYWAREFNSDIEEQLSYMESYDQYIEEFCS